MDRPGQRERRRQSERDHLTVRLARQPDQMQHERDYSQSRDKEGQRARHSRDASLHRRHRHQYRKQEPEWIEEEEILVPVREGVVRDGPEQRQDQAETADDEAPDGKESGGGEGGRGPPPGGPPTPPRKKR